MHAFQIMQLGLHFTWNGYNEPPVHPGEHVHGPHPTAIKVLNEQAILSVIRVQQGDFEDVVGHPGHPRYIHNPLSIFVSEFIHTTISHPLQVPWVAMHIHKATSQLSLHGSMR